MRILVISNLYPSEQHPHFGTFIGARVEALRRAGADVRVVAITSPSVHKDRGRKYASMAARATVAAVSSRLHRTGKFDLVEAHIAFPTGLIAAPIARFLGRPLVLFAHGSDVMVVPWRSRRTAALARRVFGAADLILANSAFLAGEIDRRFHPDPTRLAVVSPGIDFGLFAAGERDPGGREGILFVGRLVPEKGASVLLQAISRTATPAGWKPTVTIVGAGPIRSELESEARTLGISAVFTGPLTPAQVADQSRRAAIVVVPSVCQEGLGLVALEAMASGALVVASGIGGLKDTVTEGSTGFQASPGDPVSLAQALGRALAVLNDPQASAEMLSAASNLAKTHDVDAAARTSLTLYEGLR